MIQAWLGLALLSAAWLFGMDYYFAANGPVALVLVAAGAWLVGAAPLRLPSRRDAAWALALLLPGLLVTEGPGRWAIVVAMAGLAASLCPPPTAWSRRFVAGLCGAGVVLVTQSVAIALYASLTARGHEAPGILAEVPRWVAAVLGIESTRDGAIVALHSMRQVHRLAATWDMLFDPATCLFLVGGAALLAAAHWSAGGAQRRRRWLGSVGLLAAVTAGWLVVRLALLVALLLHRELRSDYEAPLHAMNHFFAPAVLSGLLLPLALLCRRFVGWPSAAVATSDAADEATSPRLWPVALGFAGAAGLWALGLYWEPAGTPKAGRVMIVEKHSTWEPSTRPYDTRWYGEPSGYNYAMACQYAARRFEIARLLENDPIDDAKLANCDVLWIKTPTARYTPSEVAAVVKFVERGGGLLLMGEHTNFMRSSAYMNDIARHFGFVFRHDLLFGTEVAYDQHYDAPAVPHPIIQRMPFVDFAVSCSIDPGTSLGRAVIQSTGLWSLPPDYNMENFFPVPVQHPDMQYGAFIQLWAAKCGKGRVAAFTDSTQFSNFSLFEPGKQEMLMGMFDWLNRAGSFEPWWLLWPLALLVAGLSLWKSRGQSERWPLLAAAVVAGFGLGGWTAGAANRAVAAPLPVRPGTDVMIDRTVSSVTLSKGGFPATNGQGYAVLEQWTPRLGYFTARRSGKDAFSGNALIVICPSHAVPADYRERLVKYVEAGGRLVVFDSPENTRSTANSLLWPFGLAVHRERLARGRVIVGTDPTGLPGATTVELSGGDTLARIDGKPAVVQAKYGKGSVLAVGFGSQFNDVSMGGSWVAEPDEAMLARYAVLFGLLRSGVEGKPLAVETITPDR